MDFITKFHWMVSRVDSIWVIIDKLTKSAYFIPIAESISAENLASIYIREVFVRHGVPVSVVSN